MPQTRSQAQHQAETAADSAVVSPLTKLLSQYALLTSVCQHLSSADVVHLGQTSREHWQYIGAGPATLRILIALTVCGGRGIQARAAVFGHWRGDAAQGAALCRGKEAKPCADCGAKVCNVSLLFSFFVLWIECDLTDLHRNADSTSSTRRWFHTKISSH